MVISFIVTSSGSCLSIFTGYFAIFTDTYSFLKELDFLLAIIGQLEGGRFTIPFKDLILSFKARTVTYLLDSKAVA